MDSIGGNEIFLNVPAKKHADDCNFEKILPGNFHLC